MHILNTTYTQTLMRLCRNLLVLSLIIGSAKLYAVPLSFGSPPSIEAATFILSTRSSSNDTKIINISADCERCPTSLTLTTESSIGTRDSDEFISLHELNDGRRYQAVYISYDPNTKNVFSILLR